MKCIYTTRRKSADVVWVWVLHINGLHQISRWYFLSIAITQSLKEGKVSRSGMAVLFPDGEIRYGLFDGTGSSVLPRLFESVDEAWDLRDKGGDWWMPFHPPADFDREQGEPVRIFNGMHEWEGRATREFITSAWHGDTEDQYADDGWTVIKSPTYWPGYTEPDWVVWR